MNRIIVREDNGRKYYLYDPSKEIKHLPLVGQQIENLLTNILQSDIKEITEKPNIMELTFNNDVIMRIYSPLIFEDHFDLQDSYFRRLARKMKLFLEKESLKTNKNRINNKKVNRAKNKQMPKKAIVSFSSVLTACVMAINLSMAKQVVGKITINNDKPKSSAEYIVEDQSPKIIHNNSISEEELLAKWKLAQAEYQASNPKVEDMSITDNEIAYDTSNEKQTAKGEEVSVEFAFDDATANGKLEQTITNCSPYLDKWIERYGLPKDLTYALVCQEYGQLDCTINSGGACGPMQLQVEAFHNDNAIEYLQVPVYENGKLTGEYDEFYVADERKLDDPRLVGQNYLVMQNLENNFQIGCAQLRRCIDKYKNIFLAVDAYNKGLYAMSSACSEEELAHYENDFNDFSWTNIIPSVYGENYGDKNYLWNVLRFLDTGTRGEADIEYYYNGELISIDLTNTNVYNNDLVR